MMDVAILTLAISTWVFCAGLAFGLGILEDVKKVDGWYILAVFLLGPAALGTIIGRRILRKDRD